MRKYVLPTLAAIAVAGAFAWAAPNAEAGKPGRPAVRPPAKGMRPGGKSIRRYIAPYRHTVAGNGFRHTVQQVGHGRRAGFGSYAGLGFAGGGYGYGAPFGNYGFGGYGFGFGLPYATGRIPTPPYFAIHPPVYYSAPVARTYGYSPFAYPGRVRTPELAAATPTPCETVNPYVEQTKADSEKKLEPTPAKTGEVAKSNEPEPQEIINPYVNDPSQFPAPFDMEVVSAD